MSNKGKEPTVDRGETQNHWPMPSQRTPMSSETVTEILVTIAPDLDKVQRDLVLHYLTLAATDLTYIAWQCTRADRAAGGVHAESVRALLERIDDLRRAYVKLGGYVHPDAKCVYPEDTP